MGEGLYHFQLVPGAVAVAWRPAAFSAALTLLPNAALCFFCLRARSHALTTLI